MTVFILRTKRTENLLYFLSSLSCKMYKLFERCRINLIYSRLTKCIFLCRMFTRHNVFLIFTPSIYRCIFYSGRSWALMDAVAGSRSRNSEGAYEIIYQRGVRENIQVIPMSLSTGSTSLCVVEP